MPSISAIACGEDCEGSIDGITNEYSVGAASGWNQRSIFAVASWFEGFPLIKLNGVPKAIFVWVGEEEFPGLAAVGGFVEAGEVAFAAGHDDGDIGVEGLDAAEVEFFGSGWDGAELPDEAAVFGAEDGAVGSAGPGDAVAYTVDAPEAGGCVGVFDVPLSLRSDSQGENENKYGEAHEWRVTDGSAVVWASFRCVLHWNTPPPRYFSTKVFETKDLSTNWSGLSLDFGLDSDDEKARLLPGSLFFVLVLF